MSKEAMKLALEALEQARGALAYVAVGNAETNPNLARSTCSHGIYAIDKVEPALREALAEQPAQQQEPDWKDQYEKQKRRAEMWIAKYEADIGPLEKAGPVTAQQPVVQCTESDSWNCKYCRKTESCKALQDPRNFAGLPAQQQQELTKAMIDAAERIDWSDSDVRGNIVNMWQAMCAAAPQPAQQEPVAWLVCENWRKHSLFFTEEGAEDFKNAAQREDALSGNLARWKAKPLYTSPPAQPAQQLPFGVGGGLVAIKTLLSRDPCAHAKVAIEMIDAMLSEQPAQQEPVAWRWLYNGQPDSEKHFSMPGPDAEVISLASACEFPRTVQYLYTSPQPSKPLTDEREAFEAHWYTKYHSGSVSARSDGSYVHPHVQRAWEAWLARAAQE